MDGVGSAIRVDTRGREVMRILPRVNEAVNEEWISDKTRHVVDGLRTQRLDRPYIRENGKLRAATWPEAFAAIAAKAGRIDGKRIGAIAGDLAAVEEMFALKELLAQARLDQSRGAGRRRVRSPRPGRASYIFNPTIAGIEQADALLIVGSNPRKEAAVLNARIRKRWRTGQLKIGVIGDKADLTYDLRLSRRRHGYAGRSRRRQACLRRRAEGRQESDRAGRRRRRWRGMTAPRCWRWRPSSRPDSARSRTAGTALRVLHDAASRVGALDIGFAAGAGGLSAAQMTTFGTLDVLFLLGADEIKVPDGTFVVYIGTHGDRGAHRADVILPGAAYTEKSGIYVNTEGRVQIGEPRGVPAGRGARGLGDHPRAVGRAGQEAALRLARRAAPGAVQGRAASDAHRPDRGRRRRRRSRRSRASGGERRQGAVQVVRSRISI